MVLPLFLRGVYSKRKEFVFTRIDPFSEWARCTRKLIGSYKCCLFVKNGGKPTSCVDSPLLQIAKKKI